MLFVGERISPLAVQLFQDFIHSLLLSGFAGDADLTAQIGTATAPPLESTFPVRANLARAAFEAPGVLGEIVTEDAILEIAPVLEHMRLDSHQDLDEQPQ